MQEIDLERDNIILLTIASRGFDAMPQDYAFLKRYALLNIYYELVDSKLKGLSTKELESALKSRAKAHIDQKCNFAGIKAHRDATGDKSTKAFLLNNPLYWKTFLQKVKKLTSNENIGTDKTNCRVT